MVKTYELERSFAVATAQEAGALLMKYYGQQNAPQWKSSTNFKTAVDDMSDKLIRQAITGLFPDDDIYSEEVDPLDRDRERKWVFDPLDGTLPYTTHQNNNFSVAMALIEGSTPVVGVVFMPARNEMYVAVSGQGAFCYDGNCNESILVSSQDDVNKTIIGLDDGKEISGWFKRSTLSPLLARMSAPDGASCFLRTGCASVPLCHVASGRPNISQPLVGRLDAYIAAALEPWDMTAEVVIAREAGGKVTHLSGKEWEFSRLYQGDPSILAASPTLHEKLLNLLEREIPEFYRDNDHFIRKK